MDRSSLDQFTREGYCVVEGLLDEQHCADLLAEVIRAFRGGEWFDVHARDFRAHCAVPLTPRVEQAVRALALGGRELLESFLRRRQLLVELSSITVFPHARAQLPHPDERDPTRHIVSVFVNLTPTAAGVGALRVCPASRDQPPSTQLPSRLLELPAGSAVFMDGKLVHCGTENTSADRIRPVFYVSFGDDDISGPAYSIMSAYRGKYALADFLRDGPL